MKICQNKNCYWFFNHWEEQQNCVLSFDMTNDCLENNFEHCLISLKKLTGNAKLTKGELLNDN